MTDEERRAEINAHIKAREAIEEKCDHRTRFFFVPVTATFVYRFIGGGGIKMCRRCGKTFWCEPSAAGIRDRIISEQIDGHYCYDWDGLAVSALTPEYDCCVDFPKTVRGRIVNWFFMRWFRLQELLTRWKEKK